MKAVVFTGDRTLELMEVPDPTPGPGEVVLEDQSVRDVWWRSSSISGASKKHIAGHEPCGVVAAVGVGVLPEEQVKVGDRVMDHHYGGCGVCKHCREGWSQMCLEGTIVYGGVGDGACQVHVGPCPHRGKIARCALI